MSLERYGSLTLEQIEETEKKIGHKFPDDYKEFLMKTNGGMFRWSTDEDVHDFYVEPIEEENIGLDSFYGVGEEACDYLVIFNQEYGDEAEGGILIGGTLSNGFIVYDYLGNIGKPGIYFWDSCGAYEESKDGNVYFIANDFNELLKLCNLKLD